MKEIKFGRWTVLSLSTIKGRYEFNLCRCICGTVRHVRTFELKAGNSKSCGCLNREISSQIHSTHGMSKTPEYVAWHNMIKRCNNPNVQCYYNYGGRGIKVCKRWMKFENFIKDMGLRPSSAHSLERVNNNGNYKPSNCKWATRSHQNNNTRLTRMITAKGVTMSVTGWSVKMGLSRDCIWGRICRGWADEPSVLTPLNK